MALWITLAGLAVDYDATHLWITGLSALWITLAGLAVDYTRGARCGLGRCGWENKRGAEGRGVAPHVMMD